MFKGYTYITTDILYQIKNKFPIPKTATGLYGQFTLRKRNPFLTLNLNFNIIFNSQ